MVGERMKEEREGARSYTDHHTQLPYSSVITHVLCNSPAVTDHSIFPSQQSFSRKPPSDFSPFVPLPPLCHTQSSTLQLWTATPQTPLQISQPEQRSSNSLVIMWNVVHTWVYCHKVMYTVCFQLICVILCVHLGIEFC